MPQKTKLVYNPRCTYEWRTFWGDDELIPPLKQIFLMQALEKNQPWTIDRYLLVENCPHNIKVRNGSLQIKKLIDTYNGYQIFGPKKTLHFPFEPENLADIFIEMKGLTKKIDDIRTLELVIKMFGYRCQLIDVEKKRRKIQCKPKTTLDVGYFTIDTQSYWSVCLEAKKPEHLLSPSEKIFLQKNCVEGYVDFFRRIKEFGLGS